MGFKRAAHPFVMARRQHRRARVLFALREEPSMRAITTALLLFAGLASTPAAAMQLTSSDVADGAPIPAAQIYPRCGGQNISPQLSWSGAPKGTKSFVLTMIDLSVPPSNWSHWIVVDLAPDVHSLARGVKQMPTGATVVISNFGDPYYDGPCPPKGTGVHNYQITIWAMPQARTSIAADAKATGVMQALQSAALDKASITGTVTP
jgi:Raf kinase inhibitor-like YbhB/YbcL family protein